MDPHSESRRYNEFVQNCKDVINKMNLLKIFSELPDDIITLQNNESSRELDDIARSLLEFKIKTFTHESDQDEEYRILNTQSKFSFPKTNSEISKILATKEAGVVSSDWSEDSFTYNKCLKGTNIKINKNTNLNSHIKKMYMNHSFSEDFLLKNNSKGKLEINTNDMKNGFHKFTFGRKFNSLIDPKMKTERNKMNSAVNKGLPPEESISKYSKSNTEMHISSKEKKLIGLKICPSEIQQTSCTDNFLDKMCIKLKLMDNNAKFKHLNEKIFFGNGWKDASVLYDAAKTDFEDKKTNTDSQSQKSFQSKNDAADNNHDVSKQKTENHKGTNTENISQINESTNISNENEKEEKENGLDESSLLNNDGLTPLQINNENANESIVPNTSNNCLKTDITKTETANTHPNYECDESSLPYNIILLENPENNNIPQKSKFNASHNANYNITPKLNGENEREENVGDRKISVENKINSNDSKTDTYRKKSASSKISDNSEHKSLIHRTESIRINLNDHSKNQNSSYTEIDSLRSIASENNSHINESKNLTAKINEIIENEFNNEIEANTHEPKDKINSWNRTVTRKSKFSLPQTAIENHKSKNTSVHNWNEESLPCTASFMSLALTANELEEIDSKVNQICDNHAHSKKEKYKILKSVFFKEKVSNLNIDNGCCCFAPICWTRNLNSYKKNSSSHYNISKPKKKYRFGKNNFIAMRANVASTDDDDDDDDTDDESDDDESEDEGKDIGVNTNALKYRNIRRRSSDIQRPYLPSPDSLPFEMVEEEQNITKRTKKFGKNECDFPYEPSLSSLPLTNGKFKSCKCTESNEENMGSEQPRIKPCPPKHKLLNEDENGPNVIYLNIFNSSKDDIEANECRGAAGSYECEIPNKGNTLSDILRQLVSPDVFDTCSKSTKNFTTPEQDACNNISKYAVCNDNQLTNCSPTYVVRQQANRMTSNPQYIICADDANTCNSTQYLICGENDTDALQYLICDADTNIFDQTQYIIYEEQTLTEELEKKPIVTEEPVKKSIIAEPEKKSDSVEKEPPKDTANTSSAAQNVNPNQYTQNLMQNPYNPFLNPGMMPFNPMSMRQPSCCQQSCEDSTESSDSIYTEIVQYTIPTDEIKAQKTGCQRCCLFCCGCCASDPSIDERLEKPPATEFRNVGINVKPKPCDEPCDQPQKCGISTNKRKKHHRSNENENWMNAPPQSFYGMNMFNPQPMMNIPPYGFGNNNDANMFQQQQPYPMPYGPNMFQQPYPFGFGMGPNKMGPQNTCMVQPSCGSSRMMPNQMGPPGQNTCGVQSSCGGKKDTSTSTPHYIPPRVCTTNPIFDDEVECPSKYVKPSHPGCGKVTQCGSNRPPPCPVKGNVCDVEDRKSIYVERVTYASI